MSRAGIVLAAAVLVGQAESEQEHRKHRPSFDSRAPVVSTATVTERSAHGGAQDQPVERVDELVARIRGADPRAEADLVERYRRGVSIILRAESSDPGAVDDLFQDTFRIALEKIRTGQLREPKKLSGFICAVARNLVVEHFRRVAARRISSGLRVLELASLRPDPLEDALCAERGATVQRVLSEMPSDRDRQILLRFYVAEDEKVAICRDLHLTSLHFNRVLFRARGRYRALYLESAKNKQGPARTG